MRHLPKFSIKQILTSFLSFTFLLLTFNFLLLTFVVAPANAQIPAGKVSFFNLTACPTGWTAFTAGAGRYIVGRAANESIGSTVGTALSSLENRAVGQHNHAITDPGHTHTVTGSGGGSGAGSTFPANMNPLSQTTSSNGTGITIQNSGSVAGTNAPYIQLLVCVKN